LRLTPNAAIGIALLAAALVGTPPSWASKGQKSAEKGEVAEKKADLRELRDRIDGLQKEIAAAEGSRTEVADQLRDSERAISKLQRDLKELGEERGELQGELRTLGDQSRSLEVQLAAQREQLARLVYNQYLRGSPDTLQLLLNGDDPSQIARNLHYLGELGRARAELLGHIEATLKRKQDLTAQTEQRAQQLAGVEARQKEKHGHLVSERDHKKETLSKISSRISAQKREVGALQRDEKRLTQLIDRLAQLIAAQSKPRPKTRPTPSVTPGGKPAAAPEIENTQLPEAAPAGSFARQKGSLRLPVKGTIGNRFGTPRQEGSPWKGLFIRSPVGSEVRAIAGGRVVFAEWMRGFGNLIIVDHGDSYLSIYGNNDALLKNVGDTIRGGDKIASVGNSGGNPESGLYFEIRHRGQPVDPMKWASVK
jgi:septal ring factor EnvC (AmiA/AmiB activator)